MSKEYDVYWRVIVEDNEIVRADSEEEAEEKVLDMLPSRLVGHAIDSIGEVEVTDVEDIDGDDED